MDSSPSSNPEEHQQIQEKHLFPFLSRQFVSSPSPFATASLSPSFSTILPAQFLNQPKVSSLFSSLPSHAKIPTQASAVLHLSLSSETPFFPKLSSESIISSGPLLDTLSLIPRCPSDPSNPAAIRRASIVWFRNDLRVHDNECLNSANNDSMAVLPVYCFDPKEYGKSSSGFDKTGSYRASILIQSVTDLRKNLQARGSDLIVRVGKPENVLVELAKAIGAEAVYAHREVSHEEVKAEERIEAALKDEGIEVKYFWGSTLFHVDDLPFKLEDFPSHYSGFREKVQSLYVRKIIASLDQLKGKPSRGDLEPGEIPSLMELRLNQKQDGKGAATTSMVGGETEALQRLKEFMAECLAQPPKESSQDSIYGANFSCKISPWLAMGCISPRSVFDELKKAATRALSAGSNGNDGDNGMNWLIYELLWRDFFRFITKKCSSPKKQLEASPMATACIA